MFSCELLREGYRLDNEDFVPEEQKIEVSSDAGHKYLSKINTIKSFSLLRSS